MEFKNEWIEGTGFKKVVLSINSKDLILLQKAVKPAADRALKKYEKLRDIHESGEATEEQCDQMGEALEELETFQYFLKLK